MVIQFPARINNVSLRCNKCGRVIQTDTGFFNVKNYIMPYESKHDFDTMNLILCVDCLDEFVENCNINPITKYEDQEGEIL